MGHTHTISQVLDGGPVVTAFEEHDQVDNIAALPAVETFEALYARPDHQASSAAAGMSGAISLIGAPGLSSPEPQEVRDQEDIV
jgi:hypothetical protein